MTSKTKLKKCPVCSGVGKIPVPRSEKSKVEQKHDMARTLVKAGYSFREVAEFLGYKSSASVTHALKQK